MLTFPLHNAALDLKGKPPEELPHGLLTIPEEVRELVEREPSAGLRPETFESNRETMLNLWTVGWYFDNLCHQVLYRETAEGPEIVAVGSEEVRTLRAATPPEEHRQLKSYLGY